MRSDLSLFDTNTCVTNSASKKIRHVLLKDGKESCDALLYSVLCNSEAWLQNSVH